MIVPTFKKLDPVLHSELRLAIMSFLMIRQETDFNELRETTNATSGNLSVQLKKLEEAGYAQIVKGFKDNYQHTSVLLTPVGREAFEAYIEALKSYFSP